MHLSLSLSTPVIFILSCHDLILIMAYASFQCSPSQFMSIFDLNNQMTIMNKCGYFIELYLLCHEGLDIAQKHSLCL